MRIVVLTALTAAISLTAQAGKPGSGSSSRCTDTYVSFTIADYQTGMSSDNVVGKSYGNIYANGVNGVIARFNCDGDSAELSGDTVRSSYLNLGTALDGKAPSWAGSPAPIAFFNIPFGNCFNNADPTTCSHFTTYLKLTMGAPNTGSYFDMENASTSAGGLQSPASGVNNPCATAQVEVTYYPAGTPAATVPVPTPPAPSTGTGAPNTWYVVPLSSLSSCGAAPTPLYIGTLYSGQTKTQDIVGQFNIPFQILIQQ